LKEMCFRAREFSMKDIKRNRSTTMKVLSRNTKETIDDSFFTERQLTK